MVWGKEVWGKKEIEAKRRGEEGSYGAAQYALSTATSPAAALISCQQEMCARSSRRSVLPNDTRKNRTCQIRDSEPRATIMRTHSIQCAGQSIP